MVSSTIFASLSLAVVFDERVIDERALMLSIYAAPQIASIEFA
jgi:hypothetical protein